MTRALRVELLRLRSRRAVLLLVLFGLLGCLVVIGFAIKNAVPPSAAELSAGRAQMDQQIADPSFQQMLTECRAAGAAGDTSSYPAGFDCAQMMPRVEWFVNWRPPDFVREFRVLTLSVTAILTLVLAVAAVTFAGAEWSSGTIGTHLLFESRRGVVYGSKVGALAVVALAAGVIGLALAWGTSYWMASRWGTSALVQPDSISGKPTPLTAAALVGRVARALALIVGGSAGGFALAMLFRSSLAAIGLVAGHGLAGEAVLRSVSGTSSRTYCRAGWLPSSTGNTGSPATRPLAVARVANPRSSGSPHCRAGSISACCSP